MIGITSGFYCARLWLTAIPSSERGGYMAPMVFGQAGIGDFTYRGFVKVKLVHSRDGSLIVPDQLYLRSPQVWFRPCTFLPSVLLKDDDQIGCRLYFDLEESTLELTFENTGLLNHLPDGSFTYECVIRGPGDLIDRATGMWDLIDKRLHLKLFHHTDDEGHGGITRSGEFWSSAWNIQGTRKLSNVAYVYFTDLGIIETPDDLAAIAMSPRRKLHFLRDGALPPRVLPPGWKSTPLAKDVFEAEVYWSSPARRTRTLWVYVDPALIAPSHLLRHETDRVWYEVSCPAIYRVGVEPGRTLPWDGTRVVPGPAHKVFDYMVIGDATSVDGLGAPLDEENTSDTFRIHRIRQQPLEFWFEQSNQDHFTDLVGPEQEFEA